MVSPQPLRQNHGRDRFIFHQQDMQRLQTAVCSLPGLIPNRWRRHLLCIYMHHIQRFPAGSVSSEMLGRLKQCHFVSRVNANEEYEVKEPCSCVDSPII